MKLDRILALLALLFLLLGGAWWFLRDVPRPSPSEKPAAGSEESAPSAMVVKAPPAPVAAPSAGGGSAAPAPVDSTEIISEIIAAPDMANSVAVGKLLELLPKLDEAGQADAAAHIANLSSDEDAAKWSQSVIAWNLPAPAAEVLYQELNNRPHEINYPVLGAVADLPQHPKHREALETLSVISDPPPAGTTWTQWLQQKLREEATP